MIKKKYLIIFVAFFLVISPGAFSKIKKVCIGSGCVGGNFIDLNFWFGQNQQNNNEQQQNDGEQQQNDGEQQNNGEQQQNEGEQQQNEGEQQQNEGEQQQNDGEQQQNNGERVGEIGNNPPVLNEIQLLTFNLNEEVDYNYADWYRDPDGDELSFEAADFEIPGLVFENGVISGVPVNVGQYTFTLRAEDPEGAFATMEVSVNIELQNTPPNLPDQQIEIVMNQLQKANVDILEYLPNPLDNENDQVTLSIDVENVPGGFAPDERYIEALPPGIRFENNSFVGTPEEDGIYVMMLVADDGNFGISRQVLYINVVPQPEPVAGFGVYPVSILASIGEEINLDFCDENQFPFISMMDARDIKPYTTDFVMIRHGRTVNAIPGLEFDNDNCTISGTVEGGALDDRDQMRYSWILSVRWSAGDGVKGQLSTGFFGIVNPEERDLNPPQLQREINFDFRVGDEVNVLWEDVLNLDVVDSDDEVSFGHMYYSIPRLGNNVYTPGRTGIELTPHPNPPPYNNQAHIGFNGTLTQPGNYRYLLIASNSKRYQDWAIVNIRVNP